MGVGWAAGAGSISALGLISYTPGWTWKKVAAVGLTEGDQKQLLDLSEGVPVLKQLTAFSAVAH